MGFSSSSLLLSVESMAVPHFHIIIAIVFPERYRQDPDVPTVSLWFPSSLMQHPPKHSCPTCISTSTPSTTTGLVFFHHTIQSNLARIPNDDDLPL
ncbi:hypothetical protein Tco_0138918 [Tanacetum coccineum]